MRKGAPGRGRARMLLPLLLGLPSIPPAATAPEAPAPRPPPAETLPSAFAENDGSDRTVLMRSILPDLRVFVDLDPGDMPRNLAHGPLSAAEVREAVWLGIGNWASVLPGMRFRLVASPDSANLVVRFRDYGNHISGGATAEAFYPGQWRPAPPDTGAAPPVGGDAARIGPVGTGAGGSGAAAPRAGVNAADRGSAGRPGASGASAGAYDFTCGARVPGRMPDGRPCRETARNILMFQTRQMAFHAIDTLDARMHHEYLAALADRSDPRKRFFRFLPDPRYRAWPPDRSTCVAGAPRDGKPPALDFACPDDSDWAALPHAAGFFREMGPYDIAELVQHEFGHTLLGGHTGESGCLAMPPEGYYAVDRDPVLRPSYAICRAGPGGAYGYSILFAGNGIDAAWNSRGVFALDAARLAGGAAGGDCRAAPSPWHGYLTSYPKSSFRIELRDRAGGVKYVDDWAYAARLMGWPGAAPGAAAAEWFQTGLKPGTAPDPALPDRSR